MLKSDLPARRGPQHLLDRILDTPNLAQVVPQLQPEVLQRVIERCGLEDCGEIIALATPGQLARVFDLDLWRAPQPGMDEQFDADRFGVWLEVLMESGVTSAAKKLASMDVDVVVAALSQHARVFDHAAVSAFTTTDGINVPAARSVIDALGFEVGGYLVVATRTDAWDAIAALLAALEDEHHDYFDRVMRGCRRLSNTGREVDGLDDLLTDAEQGAFDLAHERERRREPQGYVTPAEARAFLQMSRELPLGHGTMAPGNSILRAYFRAIESAPAPSDAPAAPDAGRSLAAVVEMFLEAGIIPQPPRALLGGQQDPAPRLGRIQVHMQAAHDKDPPAYAMRTEELAYLTNAIVAGCSIQGRPFTVPEATDSAAAVCNLGLENWPPDWLEATGRPMPDDFLVAHDLVSVFQVGWTILHRDVAMYSAERLISVLSSLRCSDRETQRGLKALRVKMEKDWRSGAPERARDALDVIAILDGPAWVTLLGLIDECPVLHAGIAASQNSRTRAVSASAFEFISENSQIASVREFMASLPDTLRG